MWRESRCPFTGNRGKLLKTDESAELRKTLTDEAATEAFGRRLAAALPAGAFAIALRGPLGAGKSVLVRAVLRGLGVAGAVPSPTYTLVEPYATARGPVYHVDIYRLHTGADMVALGVEEWRDEGALVLVEWPERGADGMLAFDLDVALDHAEAGRSLNARALTPAGAVALARLP